MTAAERITVDAVEQAVVEFDAQDRAVVRGQIVMNFAQVGALATALSPREWEEVASYLFALLERSPLSGGKAYVAHRTIIGAIASDLRGYAQQAGEPVGLQVDLRGAASKAEERRIRERIADQEAAFDRHIDDVIAAHHVQAEHLAAAPAEWTEPIDETEPGAHDALMDAATRRALAEEDERTEIDEQPAAPSTEAPDAEYLL